jgi:hypothetical protein
MEYVTIIFYFSSMNLALSNRLNVCIVKLFRIAKGCGD